MKLYPELNLTAIYEYRVSRDADTTPGVLKRYSTQEERQNCIILDASNTLQWGDPEDELKEEILQWLFHSDDGIELGGIEYE